jgi:hypothetical protein
MKMEVFQKMHQKKIIITGVVFNHKEENHLNT